MNHLLNILILVSVIGCSSSAISQQSSPMQPKSQQVSLEKKGRSLSPEKRILRIGRHMALESKEIVRGGCWNYIDTIYNRASIPKNKREIIFKGSKNKGPYVNIEQINTGDWLYYINHSYHGIEHSGIFVRWIDKSKKIGEILSYGGEYRKKPGRYRNYDLSNVYTIIRAKP